MIVPCRKCIMCRIQLTREWKTRLTHESCYHDENSFITLTFRDEDLPIDGSVHKRDVQLFIKRLRKMLGKKRIKYYAVGEYGEQKHRPHYHILIFGWQPKLEDLFVASHKRRKVYYGSRILSAIWTKGFNVVGNVTSDSCQYVAGYVRKKYEWTTLDGVLRPFALQSTGIGARYVEQNWEMLQKYLCVKQNGKDVGLPRYYAKLLNPERERLILRREMRDQMLVEDLVKKGYEPEKIRSLYLKSLRQKGKNLSKLEEMNV